jgi:hypothetical protein
MLAGADGSSRVRVARTVVVVSASPKMGADALALSAPVEEN